MRFSSGLLILLLASASASAHADVISGLDSAAKLLKMIGGEPAGGGGIIHLIPKLLQIQ